MFDVTLIPAKVKELATKFAGVTTQILKNLQSGTATEIAALIPGGGQLDIELQGLCQTALKGCAALMVIGDSAGVKARLSRLGTDLTKLEHANDKHTFKFYLFAFETCLADLDAPEESAPAVLPGATA